MKVRKNAVYEFHARGWDVFDRKSSIPQDGTLVRVIHPHGCPPPNTMGHCHVETLAGKFVGLVCCGSLTKQGASHG